MLRRRALAVIQASLLLVSAALALSVIMGAAGHAGAVPTATSSRFAGTTAAPTTKPGCVVGCTTAPPTTLPTASTAPPTTVRRTTTPTRAPIRTLAPFTGQTFPTSTVAPTTTTITTIPGIGGHLPVAPSTLPLTTKQQSSHVSPVFAALSGVGFFIALVIVGVRFLLTRSGRK